MILSDKTIKELIENGELEISPMNESTIQPGSVDLRIGNDFLVPRKNINGVGFGDEILYANTKGSYTLYSHDFVLATTMEYIKLPADVGALVSGRSSIGRMGLFVENAGWVDPGFEGEITLELFNASGHNILLEEGHRVCQLIFFKMDQEAEFPYRGKYQKQRGATGSKKFED